MCLYYLNDQGSYLLRNHNLQILLEFSIRLSSQLRLQSYALPTSIVLLSPLYPAQVLFTTGGLNSNKNSVIIISDCFFMIVPKPEFRIDIFKIPLRCDEFHIDIFKIPLRCDEFRIDIFKIPLRCDEFHIDIFKIPLRCDEFRIDIFKIPLRCDEFHIDIFKVPLRCDEFRIDIFKVLKNSDLGK